MACDVLFKDIGEVYSRLFDHRPVLCGEVTYFIKEFEEKRGNRELVKLQQALEAGREISENLITSAVDHLSSNLPQLKLTVDDAVAVSEQILRNEGVSDKAEWLKERQMERGRVFGGFVNKMCERKNSVDVEIAGEVDRVTNYYKDLEEKLRLSQTTSPT